MESFWRSAGVQLGKHWKIVLAVVIAATVIFELAHDLAAAIQIMSEEHPRRRILSLLKEAIRRDIHFIERHPATLFQCLWNACWSCDDLDRSVVQGMPWSKKPPSSPHA